MSSPVLITVPELAAELVGPAAPLVLDVRWALNGPTGRESYAAGHIAGAVFADLDEELSAPAGPGVGRHPLPDIADLQAAARAWGLRSGQGVVAYDATGNLAAARAWWLLRWAGVSDVRLLDGGLPAWEEAGGPVESGDAAAPAPGDVTLVAGRLPVLDPDGVEQFVRSGGLLLDARAAERYRGEENPIDPKFGHVPGAVSAPTTLNLLADGTFRPVDALAEQFGALGVGDGRPVAVYCGSGVTAAHEIAALALAGHDAVLYPGSWSQWATLPDRPVATGAEPGEFTAAPLVTPEQAAKLVAEGAVLLDTRSEGGRARGGVIPGAIQIHRDLEDPDVVLADAVRQAQAAAGPDTPIVVICGSVNGSGPVAEKLIGTGFVNVQHVEGGQPAWKDAGLPVEEPTAGSPS